MAASDFLLGALPVAGTILGGPIGGAAGTLAAGLIGQGVADKKQKAYNKAEGAIPMVDPTQQAYLARVRQQERAMRAGTDPSSAMAQRLAGNIAGQTQSNLLRAGGPGMANNLLRSQAALGNQIGQIGANAATGADRLLSYQGGLIDNMANRVYQRQREIRNQALARYEQSRQDANNNIAASVGLLPQAQYGGVFANAARREMRQLAAQPPTAIATNSIYPQQAPFAPQIPNSY